MALDLPAAFTCGCGGQEQTIADLSGEFARRWRPDPSLPCHQRLPQRSVLAHNLIGSFPLDPVAATNPRSRTHAPTLT